MYEFEEFQGEDKWLRFGKLKEKMHKIAVAEYLKPKYDEATAKGETGVLVELSKIIVLNDDSILTKQDIEEYAKENNQKVYPAYQNNFLREFFEENKPLG